MRRFILNRLEDVSGISGTGPVAEGIVLHDGRVVLCWYGPYKTIEFVQDLETILNVHGHCGRTVIEWIDLLQ